MSLDEPEPIDSVLTFPSGYDTLEYCWVKDTAASVRLRILFVMLQSTNSQAEGAGRRKSQKNFVAQRNPWCEHENFAKC